MTLKEYVTKQGVARLLSWWIRFVFASGSWSTIGQEIPERYHREKRPFIMCFWHNRLMMAPCCWVWKKPLFVLTSWHFDAFLISSIIGYFGISVVRGSSARGGAIALKEMLRLLKSGVSVCLTPDGPRGPLYKVHAGIERLSRLAGVDILPFTYSSKRYRTLQSWDALRITWPFSPGLLAWGEPILHASLVQQTPEAAQQEIENRLRALSEEIDARARQL
ncbi:MAG: lysophospholipid acyltransferase family protein [Holosporales bacterium]|jgi:lysophospholipid acyltransferase (LPLAT)-like uncharacterized protein|nr:lysophospholipid acyltransferase family protein [Holosporales bacterium]